jgi:hypothetical protein
MIPTICFKDVVRALWLLCARLIFKPDPDTMELVRGIGLEPTTLNEARKVLNLKGLEGGNF